MIDYDSDDFNDDEEEEEEGEEEADGEEGDPYWDMELPQRRKYLYEKYMNSKNTEPPSTPSLEYVHPLFISLLLFFLFSFALSSY